MKRPMPLKIVEDHDEAYSLWKTLKFSKKTLLHFDAHIDFAFHAVKGVRQAIEESRTKDELKTQLEKSIIYNRFSKGKDRLTNIGNYIYAAMRDDIVNDFYWIIPGYEEALRRYLKNLKNLLMSFSTRDPYSPRAIRCIGGRLESKIYNKNFTFTTLNNLPEGMKDVLVDIDTDYLTTGTIKEAGARQSIAKRSPWIFPRDFVFKLQEKGIDPCCITIAYSVNGGYTPMIYKFLGDEIAGFFNGISIEEENLISKKNSAIRLIRDRKINEAQLLLRELCIDLDSIGKKNNFINKLRAHIAFMLFRIYAELGRTKEAKHYYRLSSGIDGSYKSKDNNYGPLYIGQKGKLKDAEREFKIILSVDGNNSYALCGMAQVFLKRKNIKKAYRCYKNAYMANRQNKEAIFGLGLTEFSLGNYGKSAAYLESIRNKIPLQKKIYILLARSYENLGKISNAFAEYGKARHFGINLKEYLEVLNLAKRYGIPKKYEPWIRKQNFFFKQQRVNLLKNPFKIRKRLINRIDSILDEIR